MMQYIYLTQLLDLYSKKRFIRICPSTGHTMPKPWGHDAQAVGRQCPSRGEHL